MGSMAVRSSTSISIHVPLAGHDSSPWRRRRGRFEFQSTCPLRGTTIGLILVVAVVVLFQSTCPLRGTTRSRSSPRASAAYFNPRAPCGARPISAPPPPRRSYFNPRAPCGARHAGCANCEGRMRFQSTCPLRGTTDAGAMVTPPPSQISIHVPLAGHDYPRDDGYSRTDGISIHVPLAGHDGCRTSSSRCDSNFNPRAPCGARRLCAHLRLC